MMIEIQHNSPEYHASVSLRYEVLRRPLGLNFSREQLDAEHDSFHLAMYEDLTDLTPGPSNGEGGPSEGRVRSVRRGLIGCLVLTPVSSSEIKMRQVAVRQDKQRAGIGASMVAFSERFATERGYQKMGLSARETAVPFYLKLGYIIVGEPYVEVTLPHQKMIKSLS